MKPKFPVVTGLLVGIALVLFLNPDWTSTAIYDREAISKGEWWRLLTGHFVHFSSTHLFYDIAVVIAAGGWIERASRQRAAIVYALTMFSVSVAVFFLAPGMSFYGGLSGIAMAAVTLVCLTEMENAGRNWWIWMLILAALAAKILFECASGQALFANFKNGPVVNSAMSHFVGTSVGGFYYLAEKLKQGDCFSGGRRQIVS